MNRNPTVPQNFVTLKHLKELKDKREEEDRLRKLKEEEEERLHKLKEEEEERQRLRKLKEEERRREEEEEEEKLRKQQRSTPRSNNRNQEQWRVRKLRLGSKLEQHAANDARSGANLEAQAAIGRCSNGSAEEKKMIQRKRRNNKKKNFGMTKDREVLEKTPSDLDGGGVRDGAGALIEEYTNLKEEEKKSVEFVEHELHQPVKIWSQGSHLYQPARVTGYGLDYDAVVDIEKWVSDLGVSGKTRRPTPRGRGRGRGRGRERGFGHEGASNSGMDFGHGGFSNSRSRSLGLVWVKKEAKE